MALEYAKEIPSGSTDMTFASPPPHPSLAPQNSVSIPQLFLKLNGENAQENAQSAVSGTVNEMTEPEVLPQERIAVHGAEVDEDMALPLLSSANAAADAHARCPITGKPMLEPVLASDGGTYERSAIVSWLNRGLPSPLTGRPFLHGTLQPDGAHDARMKTLPRRAAGPAPIDQFAVDDLVFRGRWRANVPSRKSFALLSFDA